MASTRPSKHPGYNLPMANAPETAIEARRLVRAAFEAWGVEDYVDAAQVVISELVTNAVRHTRGGFIRIIVERPGPDRLLLAVVDTSHDLPCLGIPVADDVRGRGLVLVDALAEHWGSTLLGPDGKRGKRVWAQLAVKSGEHR
ncbi:ATP-binding protein [Streptomyces sp. NPDC002855]|uniref:ATP-binding protein n=1 Tax=Streptomyces sp. NPDC002855 TaxID=3154437 RepID=UPI003323D65D